MPVKAGSLKFTKDQPKYYASSEWGQRGFCADCGSRIVWRPQDAGQDWLVSLDVGSLDKPEAVRPHLHIFVDRQLPWYEIADDAQRFERFPPGVADD